MILTLRKILFSSKLELSLETIVNQSSLVTVRHAAKDMNYLDRRHNIVQAFEGKLYDPATNKGPLTKNMVKKIAGSGLTYEDLKKMYIKYGEVGLIAILSKQHFQHYISRWAVNNFITLLTHLKFSIIIVNDRKTVVYRYLKPVSVQFKM